MLQKSFFIVKDRQDSDMPEKVKQHWHAKTEGGIQGYPFAGPPLQNLTSQVIMQILINGHNNILKIFSIIIWWFLFAWALFIYYTLFTHLHLKIYITWFNQPFLISIIDYIVCSSVVKQILPVLEKKNTRNIASSTLPQRIWPTF